MKLTRPIVAALLAVALFVLYWYDKRGAERAWLLEAAAERVYVFDENQAVALTIETAKGRVALERRGEDWFVAGEGNTRADATQVRTLLSNLYGAKRQSRFVSPDEELYGFARPGGVLTVTLAGTEERKEFTVEFGSGNAPLGRVFARIRGEEEGFTVGDWLFSSVARSPIEWRDRSISTGIPKDAGIVSIAGPRGKVSLHRDGDRWFASAEVRTAAAADSAQPGRADSASTVAPVDGALWERARAVLQDGRVSTFVDSATSSTAELGFDRPTLRIAVDGRESLLVGKTDAATQTVVVALPGGGAGIAPMSLFADFLKAPLEWSTKRFVWAPVELITRIETRSGTASMELERRDGTWIFADAPGVPVNQDRANELARALRDLTAVQFVSEATTHNQYGMTTPSLTLRVQAERPTTIKADGLERTFPDEGFDMGITETASGLTYLRRVQDGSYWAIDFDRASTFYKFRGDLEERRLSPGLVGNATALRITLHERRGERTFVLSRSGATWNAELPGGRRGVVPHATAERFLAFASSLEWKSELLGDPPPGVVVRIEYLRAGEAEPIDFLQVISRSEETGNFLVTTRGGTFEVDGDDFKIFEAAFGQLLRAAMKDEAPEKATP